MTHYMKNEKAAKRKISVPVAHRLEGVVKNVGIKPKKKKKETK